MNLFEFMSDSPVLSFFIICVICQTIYGIIHKIIRYFTIRKHGYPPEYCDGDGDFKKEFEL